MMKARQTQVVVKQLAALAQETRLAIFRLLVERGPEGLTAGKIGDALGLPATTLSFHLKELAAAKLIEGRQEGRFIRYSARFDAMSELVSYLTINCCRGSGASECLCGLCGTRKTDCKLAA